MPKSHYSVLTLLAAGFFLSGHAAAQQTPASSTQQSPAATPAPAAKTQTTPAAKKPATTPAAKAPLALNTLKDKASYAMGMNIGKALHRDSVDIDTALLLRGLKDGLSGGATLMTDDEAKAAFAELQKEVTKAVSDNNKKKGDAFLADNKTKAGVVALPSGLQYKILQPGTGPTPTLKDTVVCNYRGTLLDGKEFDSSSRRGQPATFALNQVIKGWTEALQLMPVGSKWQLFIPPDLAYGDRSAGPDISPNSTLIFEVELLSIKPAVEKPTALPSPNPQKPADNPTAKPADKPETPAPSADKPKP